MVISRPLRDKYTKYGTASDTEETLHDINIRQSHTIV
jgi:hypothetical protein